MSDGTADGTEDVVGVLTEQIESRFGMTMDELRAAVAAGPATSPEAAGIVTWHGLLTASQTALGQAEDDLLAALETQPSEVDDPTMDLAHRVNTAVRVRDGRAMVVRWLLDPIAPGKQGAAAEPMARPSRGMRQGPAVRTSAPARPATAPVPGRGARR
ncbi:hypothetical protein ABZ820_05050 [Streptomyces diacarni]|uniref:hypothetical protein n=1 Tax=Streptomyces diacarni TaxID=2800381 RepID=UPI0033D1DEA8